MDTDSHHVRILVRFGLLVVCTYLLKHVVRLVLPEQDTSLAFEVDPWNDGQGLAESEAFVKKQLTSVVQGQQPARTYPPSLELLCFRAFTVSRQHT
jgi:hypothetical protein